MIGALRKILIGVGVRKLVLEDVGASVDEPRVGDEACGPFH